MSLEEGGEGKEGECTVVSLHDNNYTTHTQGVYCRGMVVHSV